MAKQHSDYRNASIALKTGPRRQRDRFFPPIALALLATIALASPASLGSTRVYGHTDSRRRQDSQDLSERLRDS
jgi:hypothetical protein